MSVNFFLPCQLCSFTFMRRSYDSHIASATVQRGWYDSEIFFCTQSLLSLSLALWGCTRSDTCRCRFLYWSCGGGASGVSVLRVIYALTGTVDSSTATFQETTCHCHQWESRQVSLNFQHPIGINTILFLFITAATRTHTNPHEATRSHTQPHVFFYTDFML